VYAIDQSEGGTTVSIYETIELVATTPNGHDYLDGVFPWEPLAVQLREGGLVDFGEFSID
jgi:hypothetical protein